MTNTHIVTLTALLTLLLTPLSASSSESQSTSLWPTQTQSAHGYAIDFIRGEGAVNGIKLAYQYNIDQPLNVSWPMTLTMETSANFWEYGDDNQYDSNVVLALSPILRFPLTTVFDKPIDLELGIGVSLLDDTQFAGKDVSTHYQFEDRIGFSTTFGQYQEYRVSLRYFHYSNAGFKKPNPGLDFVSLSFSQRL
ncbi:MAG: acyloxyacyl hydrolase [Alteromonas sp.]|jgi:hypothetical protein|uniref:Lipid A deacylase n=1 Tax=Alteromonas naphthalenivorans TaxID=715451 RepID=F5ZEL4_ALTNA|nr:acyloxyacyl hydrolase [Alteromonas naphthalenivorans]AEF04484.1 hypothetical protein ambt_14870 [Alteromonas naphthalenivorans]PHS58653.1 MAG: acyloxyacyl hydrolase [Alteromonas sp.]